MNETEKRQQIVAEAESWLRTPYHHQGFVKGAGVDCAFLLVKVYHACGLIPDIDPRPYPPDWHLHRSEERYLSWVEKYAIQVEEPKPGDIVLYQFGRCISHGAIVVKWPMLIHSYVTQGCTYADATKNPLADRQRAIYSLWGK